MVPYSPLADTALYNGLQTCSTLRSLSAIIDSNMVRTWTHRAGLLLHFLRPRRLHDACETLILQNFHILRIRQSSSGLVLEGVPRSRACDWFIDVPFQSEDAQSQLTTGIRVNQWEPRMFFSRITPRWASLTFATSLVTKDSCLGGYTNDLLHFRRSPCVPSSDVFASL